MHSGLNALGLILSDQKDEFSVLVACCLQCTVRTPGRTSPKNHGGTASVARADIASQARENELGDRPVCLNSAHVVAAQGFKDRVGKFFECNTKAECQDVAAKLKPAKAGLGALLVCLKPHIADVEKGIAAAKKITEGDE